MARQVSPPKFHPQKCLDNNICVQDQIVQTGVAIWRSLVQNKGPGGRIGNHMVVAGNCRDAGTAVEGCSLHSSQALSDPRTSAEVFGVPLHLPGQHLLEVQGSVSFAGSSWSCYFYSSTLLGSQEMIWPKRASLGSWGRRQKSKAYYYHCYDVLTHTPGFS